MEARANCLRLNAKSLFIMWSEESGYKMEYLSAEEPKDFQIPELPQEVSDAPFVFTE